MHLLSSFSENRNCIKKHDVARASESPKPRILWVVSHELCPSSTLPNPLSPSFFVYIIGITTAPGSSGATRVKCNHACRILRQWLQTAPLNSIVVPFSFSRKRMAWRGGSQDKIKDDVPCGAHSQPWGCILAGWWTSQIQKCLRAENAKSLPRECLPSNIVSSI